MDNIAFIIEDNEDISKIFSKAVEAAGFQSEIIYNGKTALSRLGQEAPLLVVLDMHLPEVNGEVLLDYIRSASHLKETKVIVATADSNLSQFHQNSANLVLEKPVTFSQMRDLAKRCKTAQLRKQ